MKICKKALGGSSISRGDPRPRLDAAKSCRRPQDNPKLVQGQGLDRSDACLAPERPLRTPGHQERPQLTRTPVSCPGIRTPGGSHGHQEGFHEHQDIRKVTTETRTPGRQEGSHGHHDTKTPGRPICGPKAFTYVLLRFSALAGLFNFDQDDKRVTYYLRYSQDERHQLVVISRACRRCGLLW